MNRRKLAILPVLLLLAGVGGTAFPLPAGAAPARPLARTDCPNALINTPTTIAANDFTYDNQVVTVHGAALTVVGHHTFCGLIVESGGVVTHAPADTGGLYLTVAGNCTVDASSIITAAGRGYSGGNGLGSPGITSPYCPGASHGGEGGRAGSLPASRVIYGSVEAPGSLGSSGGTTSTGGDGGGRIHLVVSAILHVDGAIVADGGSPLGYDGGGSGGSIWLQANTLEGSGFVSASGGPAHETYGGGGGGGGRIAVYVTTLNFPGPIRTLGGAGYQRGGAGTVLTKIGAGLATVTIANSGADPTAAATTFAGTTASLDANVVVKDGGKLAPPVGDSLWLTVTGSLTVESTGYMSADGRGFAGGTGPGSPGITSPYCPGGSHAGEGGNAGGLPGSTVVYGSILQPTSRGSGGGKYSEGGAGGGALRLTVGSALIVDGILSADGTSGSTYDGGGSGGSLWLEPAGLGGAGTISASGGAAHEVYGGGGGSGGRIALYCGVNNFAGQVRTNGGAGYQRGAGGTYLIKLGSSRPTILITNTGADMAAARTTFASRVTSLDANIIVRDGGVVAPAKADSLWLSVTGNLTVEATGAFNGDGRGYAGGTGPGSPGIGSPYEPGASHAGDGGGASGHPAAHIIYGSVTQPTSLGSGGGKYSQGGSGGGSIRVTVAGVLIVNGALTADGGSGSTYDGGGSGGSLWLEAANLQGSGVISASGGAAHEVYGGGGGSGGRLALYYSAYSFAGQVLAVGGAGYQRAAGGTVFRKVGSGHPTVTVSNSGADLTAARTSFVGYPGYLDADVTIRDGGALAPGAGDSLWLEVQGNVTIEADGFIGAEGRGYPGGTGPGSPGITSPYAPGAAHASPGGSSNSNPGSTSTYGSVPRPTSLGSGGGKYSEGGAGGGSLRLIVHGTLRVDGQLNADGGSGSTYDGGGSGGSVWLELDGLTGTGSITARGGAAHETYGGGGGSGGHVAIYSKDCFTNFDIVNQVLVTGGAGYTPGGIGTRFLGFENVALGGVEDEFVAPMEAASPSANLVAGLGGGATAAFDVIPSSGKFAHTITGVPPTTHSAKLALRVKAGAGATSDRIVLGFSDAGGFHEGWGRYIGALNGFADPGLLPRQWTSGRDTTVILDIANLPLAGGGTTSLVSLMSAAGFLDVVVQSHTGVDYTVLTYGTCGAGAAGVDGPASPALPTRLSLSSAPNPFSRRTAVTFAMPRAGVAKVGVFDVAGRQVKSLYSGIAQAGEHQVNWDGSAAGEAKSGVYFVRVEAGGEIVTRKVVFAR